MNGERIAIYAGTRNIYHDMVVSAKSLLYNHGADTIYFLIEDDMISESIPSCIHCVNVSNQQYFRHDGPNYHSRWTYMVMMRVALTKLFPQCDRILALDHDTIVRKPIDYLWNLDISNYYYALVEEKQIRGRTKPYFNFGVGLHNLAKLRQDRTDDTIINTVNSVNLAYCEQDAVNSVCRNFILELPPEYNALCFNIPQVPEDDVIIKHYATRNRYLNMYSDYKHYNSLPWDEVIN